jgi:hypothetical protein
MAFIWTRKIAQAQPQVQEQPQVQIPLEVVQEIKIPVYEPDQDKISVTEHKENGKCLVSSCKEDDAFGSGEKEVDGEEVVLPCTQDGEGELSWTQGEEDSSPLASLKK